MILDRYILSEMIKVFLLSVAVMTAVMFVDKVLFLTEIVTNKGVELSKVFFLLLYVSPAFLVVTVPMSLLASSLITFNRITADSEMDAIKSAGVSFYRLMAPVFAFSVCICIFTYYLMIVALPAGNSAFRSLIFNVIKQAASMQIKERVFNQNFNNFTLYVEGKSSDGKEITGVFISQKLPNGKSRLITAEKGVFLTDDEKMEVTLKLSNGNIHNYVEETQSYQHLSFGDYYISLSVSIDTGQGKRAMKGNKDLSVAELSERIHQLKAEGKPYTTEMVSLNKIFSIPFACLLLGFIGAPLGMHSRRSGKSGGFAVSLIVVLIYYLLMISGEGLGSAGKIHPAVAMWLPNALMGIIAFYLIYKTANERPFTFIRRVSEGVEGLILRLLPKQKTGG